MIEKKFRCTAEQLPIAVRLALSSFKVDREDFEKYAPSVFNEAFLTNANAKIVGYEQLTKASDVQKHQKVISTQSLPATLKELKVLINALEGYLKLSENELDIKRDDFGLVKLREAIHTKDVAGVVAAGNSVLLHIKRNKAMLAAKGMKESAIDEIADKISQAENLKESQNELKNRTGRVSQKNIEAGNELWDILKTITDTGTALYKGVNTVKQKEYTMTAILKRISNSQTKTVADDEKNENTNNEAK